MGTSTALTPRISRTLMRLAPTTLPTARPGLPRTAASIPIASSGTLVPRDTTVRPIIMGRMPSQDARLVPARRSISAPMTSATSPPATSSQSVIDHPLGAMDAGSAATTRWQSFDDNVRR
jgi:hypothetical protein